MGYFKSRVISEWVILRVIPEKATLHVQGKIETRNSIKLLTNFIKAFMDLKASSITLWTTM